MENSIIKKNDKIDICIKGKEIMEKNSFFKDLSTIMENDDFSKFFNKYLNDWVDVKSIIIYMKLYSEFKEKYKKNYDEELDKEVVIFMLKKIMNDRELRSFSIKTIKEKYDNKKINFFKELENLLDIKNTKLLE